MVALSNICVLGLNQAKHIFIARVQSLTHVQPSGDKCWLDFMIIGQKRQSFYLAMTSFRCLVNWDIWKVSCHLVEKHLADTTLGRLSNCCIIWPRVNQSWSLLIKRQQNMNVYLIASGLLVEKHLAGTTFGQLRNCCVICSTVDSCQVKTNCI
jgi:hypothetical protein